MASSFYSNTQHIDFASVLAMNDPCMVSMFQALIASGLEGFLGCTAVFYETALVDLFENASVRDGVIISTVAGQLVEISEEWFVEMFELPVDGLADVSKMPTDKIFDARRIVSMTGEPVILSGLKSQMKIHYRLLFRCYQSSLPPVSIDLSAALADFQAILSEQINKSQSEISSRLHKIEQGLRDSLREQAEVFKNLFQGARQEGRSIDDVQTLRFNEFRKHILAQKASIFTGLADVRKEVQEVNAKVDIIASRVNGVEKNVEETKEALSHQLLEFQSQAQANQNILHAQLSEHVNYINRGSADKKGEGSSCPLPTPVRVERRPLPTPQPPPDDQGSGQFLSAEHAAELVREADRRESDRLERERAREMRERRLSRSGSYKRRRGQKHRN
ncbi:hypothetical protein F511_05678 [Dorcoceras hygrometricum]|uniref:Dystroglycan-like n=1 Tax=Dorcoceras hygrometricum TaxID=472368 RepID=A0A2Z7C057_9LAMI|nr:hypothetical protein F511_05678 [Dorcoceras hygrometricum]